MEAECHSEEVFVVVVDEPHASDEVDVELVEAEMPELCVLLLHGSVGNVVGVIEGDVVGQSRR